MQKSVMPVIVVLLALAIVLVGLDAARERRTAAAAGDASTRSGAAGKAAKTQSAAAPAPVSASSNAANAAPENSADDDSASVIRLVRDPSPAPPFLVNDLDGNVISTAAYRGKVVIVNFWATWCEPCREEIPEMIELANRYQGKLQIVGISMDDDPPSDVRDFARAQKMNYPIVMDGKLSEEYGGIPALPTSFVLDTEGRVVQKHVGVYPIEVYDNEIRALLGMHVSEPVETFEDTGQIFLKNVARATELPGVDFSGLTPGLKRVALKRLNSERCTCGCNMTIAQCRINDPDCATSKALAAKIIAEIKATANPPTADLPAASSAQNR